MGTKGDWNESLQDLKKTAEAPLLKMQGATVVKNGRRILDDITLTIRQGEHTVILGPNGAGKSSLMRLITRQDYPLAHADGTPPLLLFGQSLWNVFQLRALMGIISEELQIAFITRTLPGRTRGLDVVISGFFATYGVFPYQHVTGAMRDRARATLALMEASHLADAAIETMSTGEARRLMIARALVSDPKALMLDEPTAGLDLPARQRFLGTLQKNRPARQDHHPGHPPGGGDFPGNQPGYPPKTRPGPPGRRQKGHPDLRTFVHPVRGAHHGAQHHGYYSAVCGV